MSGAPPAPAPSLILTRVCDGAAAPEASQVMRQFPPRPRPGAWPATGLDREQVSGLLLADPFLLDSYGAQRQRAASRAAEASRSAAADLSSTGRTGSRSRVRWSIRFPAADTGQPAGCCC